MTTNARRKYDHSRFPVEEMRRRGRAFLEAMKGRRSIRQFSPEPVPRDIVDTAIRTAATAPSGANLQPWQFVVVGDSGLKRRIREAAEEEERRNYEGGRFPERWLRALEPLGTDWQKPFLEIAPWLVICFREDYRVHSDGRHENNYYVMESVGLACGLFITALQTVGLVTVPHTPSPMGFLAELLRRPRNEKPFILFPVGYPAPETCVPDITRKPFAGIVQDDDGRVRGTTGGPSDE